MSDGVKRMTVYLDAEVRRALRRRAAETERSLSNLVNEAVRASLAGKRPDLPAFALREPEPDRPPEEAGATLRLDPHLIRQARERAAEAGQTLTQLLEKALREFLGLSASGRETFRLDPVIRKGRIVPGVDWDDRDSLYERMEGRR